MSRPSPRILMCPPEHFGIEYEINPWMRVAAGADNAKAVAQWSALVAIFRKLGVQVELLDPKPGLPDLVFTANAGLVRNKVFVPSVFRHVERQGETPIFVEWFERDGWTIDPLPTPTSFEGAGDALYCGATLFAGYVYRSEISSHALISRMFECETLSLELVDPRYYHLDTCFCPLAQGVALYYPGAFDEYGRKVLEANVATLVPVAEKEAQRFGCNAVAIGKHVVHNTGCPKMAADLQRLGFTSHETELDEFLKSGGSAKCLTLRLDGEEAAPW